MLETSSHVSPRRVKKDFLSFPPLPSALGKGDSTGKTRSSQEVFSREPFAWTGGIDTVGEEPAPDAVWMASPCDGQSTLGLSFSISTLNRLHSSTSCEPSRVERSYLLCTPCLTQLLLLLFSLPGVSDSLQPRGLQLARPPCSSPSPGVCPSSCPLHQ